MIISIITVCKYIYFLTTIFTTLQFITSSHPTPLSLSIICFGATATSPCAWHIFSHPHAGNKGLLARC